MAMNPLLAASIIRKAKELGANPLDLGTVISYETAGTFDPWKAGPTTQWGQHRGLIQMGEPQRAKYGVTQNSTIDQQMDGVGRYLKDAGFKPGMGILDLYSAINAGKVGRYNASDANNGGAPGTVRDKVEKQMGAHRAKAETLLSAFDPSIVPENRDIQNPGGQNPVQVAGGQGTVAQPWIVNSLTPIPVGPDPVSLLQQQFAQQQADEHQAQAARAQADQERRKALFANYGSMFG